MSLKCRKKVSEKRQVSVSGILSFVHFVQTLLPHIVAVVVTMLDAKPVFFFLDSNMCTLTCNLNPCVGNSNWQKENRSMLMGCTPCAFF